MWIHCVSVEGLFHVITNLSSMVGGNSLTLSFSFPHSKLLSDEAVLDNLLDALLLNRSLHKPIALREDLELHLRYVLNDVVPSLARRLNA